MFANSAYHSSSTPFLVMCATQEIISLRVRTLWPIEVVKFFGGPGAGAGQRFTDMSIFGG